MVFPIGISIFQGSIFQVSWYLLGVVDLDDWLSFLGTNISLAQTLCGLFSFGPKVRNGLVPWRVYFYHVFPVWLKFDLNCIGGWVCFRFWLHHIFWKKSMCGEWGGKIIKSQHVIRSNHHAWIIEHSGSPAAETFDTDMGFWSVFCSINIKNQRGWHGPSSEQWSGPNVLQMMHIWS